MSLRYLRPMKFENSKELQSIFQRGKLRLNLKETVINGHRAHYYEVIGRRKYESNIFWANGPYFFNIVFLGENSLPEAEAIKIAEEIGY